MKKHFYLPQTDPGKQLSCNQKLDQRLYGLSGIFFGITVIYRSAQRVHSTAVTDLSPQCLHAVTRLCTYLIKFRE